MSGMDLTDPESLDWMSSDQEVDAADVNDGDIDPGHNPTFGTKDAAATPRYSEGDDVELEDGTRGVVVGIRTESFDGLDGEKVDASDTSPAYVIRVGASAEIVKASDIRVSD